MSTHPSKKKNVENAKETQAILLINEGKFQQAEFVYHNLIASGSKSHTIYGNLAAIYLIQEKYDEAMGLLKEAININPEYTEAHNNMGLILQKRGELTEAAEWYKKSISLNSSNTEAYINLGKIFEDQGDISAAIRSYRQAIVLNPNHPDAHNNIGYVLQQQGHLTDAIDSFKQALSNNPSHPDACNNLGNAYQEEGNLLAAISFYKKALSLNPNHIDAHNNLGNALQEQGNIQAAIIYYNQAISVNPSHPDAHWNLSWAKLLLREYKKGWDKYEWRRKKKNPTRPHSQPNCVPFNLDTFEQHHPLLLVSEQGLGDTLQFMRYAIALKQQGLTISICAQTKLHSLIKTSGIDAAPLSPDQGNQVSQGQWIPLLSVPQYLQVTPDNPIITKPYIKTTEPLINKWKDILSGEQKPIIGINWQGNHTIEKKGLLKGRSILLEAFAPITNHHQLSLLSLQKGFGSEQLSTCSFKHRFVSCQSLVDETWDFLETAAIVANCNLIITSDTSVAHLAAGMGKTTWLLLKKVPEWRWGLEGETSFWYPSMRLFRQTEQGNWDEVFQRVADELFQQFPIIAPDIDNNIQQENLKNQQNNLSKSQTLPQIVAPISLGELIDKITILQIKTKHLKGNALYNVQQELTTLQETLSTLDLQVDPALIQRLQSVNTDLWNIEDQIRNHERNKDFNKSFIALARSVYRKNDLRSKIKKEINCNYGSTLTEEKSYQSY